MMDWDWRDLVVVCDPAVPEGVIQVVSRPKPGSLEEALIMIRAEYDAATEAVFRIRDPRGLLNAASEWAQTVVSHPRSN